MLLSVSVYFECGQEQVLFLDPPNLNMFDADVREADKVWLLGLWFSSSAAKEGGTRDARGAEYHPLHDTRRADILSLCVKP